MRVLLTGASGLIGSRVLLNMLRDPRVDHVVAVVRARRPDVPRHLRSRVSFATGDVTRPGLGLRPRATDGVTHVVHAAADTTFSRPLGEARAVNRDGTANAVRLAERCGARRFVHLSTAYVAGTMTGPVPEAALRPAGFVNAYERSKHEAEQIVFASRLDAVVLRPSTVVCDDLSGAVSQWNAVHRALRVLHAGLAPLMPGSADTPLDFLTAAWVADATARIGLCDIASGVYHLCAGAGTIPLGDVLDRAFAIWSRDDGWRRRGIVPPVLTDIATFQDFERAVHETGDARLAAVARSLSHFAPQLGLPKRFDTARTDAALGHAAPPVAAFLDPVLSCFAGHGRRAVAA